MISSRRVTTAAAVLAIVVVALVLREPADRDGDSSAPPPSTAPTTGAPSEVPIDQFCAAFEVMAAAHSNHLANDTTASLAEVTEAGEAVLALAPGTPMPPAARAGLTPFVDGVIGRPADPAPAGSADAFSGFLEAACPLGGAPR